jgi:DNA primase catalytic subunit
MRKVLEREVGSTEGVAEALGVRHSDKWRGRAEEIADLKRKLKQASHVVPTVSVVVDQRRKIELEETIDLLHAELNETRKLKMALKCRNESLESQLQRMKQDLKILLEKDEVNDELIRELKLSLPL